MPYGRDQPRSAGWLNMLKPKLMLKLARIARLRLFSGMTDGMICSLLQISQSGLSRIIALPEYQDIENQLSAGDLTELDQALAGKKDELKAAFRPLVPAAMRALQDAVCQRKDLKTAVVAAREILQNDPDKVFVAGAPKGEELPTGVLTAAAQAASQIKTPGAVMVPPDKNVN